MEATEATFSYAQPANDGLMVQSLGLTVLWGHALLKIKLKVPGVIVHTGKVFALQGANLGSILSILYDSSRSVKSNPCTGQGVSKVTPVQSTEPDP